MSISCKQIKNNILTDKKTAMVVEYMLSKAIADGISPNLKFIYKKHKIIKSKGKYYSIYRLEDGKKIFGKIKYQDIAKYIVDNINDTIKIEKILKAEENVSRLQDSIDFLKRQYMAYKNKDLLEIKLTSAYNTYNRYKRELFEIIGKNSLC